MKKVLSVLLAAAMVMGMSVSAFAANTANGYVTYSNNATSKTCYHNDTDPSTEPFPVENLEFAAYVGENGATWTALSDVDYDLHVGDNLYFVMTGIQWEIDSCWNINIKANDYVEDAYFAYKDRSNNIYTSWAKVKAAGLTHEDVTALIVVEIVDELDSLSEKDVEFKMFISDNYDSKTKHQSVGVKVDLTFDNYKEEYVTDYNDVDYMAKWIVDEDVKPFTAIFDFEDEAYFTVKVYEEEKFVLNFTTEYDKALDKALDYEADLSFYNFKGTSDEFSKVGELVIPADDDTFIYEIVDGEFTAVEATYVEDYKVDGLNKINGWMIETNELGYYVVSDIEVEIEAEAEVEAPVEAEKANPETGAADFVGAAVAMAVVSVAAAGALALKK